MAISKNKVLKTGMEVISAYVRIDSIGGNKESLTMTVNTYMSQEAFSSGLSYLEHEIHTFIPSVTDLSPNFIKQGYEYLKSLPTYEGAIDVLEDGQKL